LVMKAAAEHLTPVLLELGGKSPLIIDKNVPITQMAPRICWGKFLNAGQTCIAPDYVLVHKDKYEEFLSEMSKSIERFYGKNPQNSPDYGRIINKHHVQRIKVLMESTGKIHSGGKIDEDNHYIEPTIIVNPDINASLMQEEIFGPVLPVIPIENIDWAIDFVNARPKPLALYIFSADNSVAERVLSQTSSGGACVNDTVLHNICQDLPFGGVGESGMGGYNGKFSFDEFSHKKGVYYKGMSADPSLRFPPYTEKKLSMLALLDSFEKKIPTIKFVALGLAVVVLAYLLQRWFI